MTAAWPLTTSFVDQSGYKESILNDPLVRTSMDSGPPKSRARFSAVVYTFEGTISFLSSANVDTLFTFYDTTLVFGSLPFTWTNPRTGSAGTFKWQERPAIVGVDGLSYQVSIKFMILPP